MCNVGKEDVNMNKGLFIPLKVIVSESRSRCVTDVMLCIYMCFHI